MGHSTQETKKMAIRIMEAVKSIYPELAEISKQTDFQITIEGDKKGVYLEFSMDWDPTADPDDGKIRREPIEAEDIDSSSLRIDEGEKELIKRALEVCDGNRKEAAKRLGFSERTLHRKIKEYKL